MLKLFKFGWLSSKEREDIRKLIQSNQELQKELSKPKVEEKPTEVKPTTPWKNMFYHSGNLTVVCWDGSVLSKSGVDRPTYETLKNLKSIQEVENLLFPSQTVAVNLANQAKQEREFIIDNNEIFRNHEDFKVVGEDVFMKKVRLPLPPVIAASFIELLEKLDAVEYDAVHSDEQEVLLDHYHALKMFWLKLALNPLESSRQDLLSFVKENDIHITKNGNLILYRRIVTAGDKNKELINFVSTEYYKIKKWKKSPKNYWVWGADDGKMELRSFDKPNGIEKFFGNLEELYKELPNMETNSFKSYHSGKNGQMEIKIGGIYKIPDDDINLNNGLCAAGGLHAANVNYNYSGFGDTPVVVLVNPSKAITVPKGDMGKLRTTEMFVACVNDKPAGQHFDEESISAFDEEYHDLGIQELEEAVSKKSFEQLAVVDNTPDLTLKDILNIKELLKERIKEVV